MCEQTFSDNYSQEFVIYNETGIDISFIVAYHHQNRKKTTAYRRLVGSFSLPSVTGVMSTFRRQQRFCSAVLLVAAKSALSILTDAFVVLGLVIFPYQIKRLACGNVYEMTCLGRVGCKTTTQSVN